MKNKMCTSVVQLDGGLVRIATLPLPTWNALYFSLSRACGNRQSHLNTIKDDYLYMHKITLIT